MLPNKTTFGNPLDERGDIIPACIAALFVLLFAFCALVDPACARFVKSAQESALSSAQAQVEKTSTAVQIKNSQTPGLDTSQAIVSDLRKSGYSGQVTVWFFEASVEQTGAAKRLFVIGVQLEEDMPTIISRGLGIESIPVGSHAVFSAVPYSAEQVWRPDTPINGIFKATAEGTSVNYESKNSITEFPAEMKAEYDTRLQQIKKGA